MEAPDDYQPIAVEAAKQEIANRKLTDQELHEARAERALQQKEKDKFKIKFSEIEDKVKHTAIAFQETIHPTNKTTTTPDKWINLISIFFGGSLLYHYYLDFILVRFILTAQDIEGWEELYVHIFVSLLSSIFLTITIILFWKRKKIGWAFLGVSLTYSIVEAIFNLLNLSHAEPLEIPLTRNITPSASFGIFFLTIFFSGSLLWVICKNAIREEYKVSKKFMYWSIGLTIIITGVGETIF